MKTIRATSSLKFERYGALINLLYDRRLVCLLVEHILASERNATHLIRSFTILFHVSYIILQTFSSLRGRLYLLRSSWTLFAQFLSSWYFNISWCIILTGSSFRLSRIFLRMQAASFQFHTE